MHQSAVSSQPSQIKVVSVAIPFLKTRLFLYNVCSATGKPPITLKNFMDSMSSFELLSAT